MLAEPRIRQKWSDDPRNTRWANDKSKFGYQMLTKMGWSEGKGLGQNETGRTSHVKIRKKKSNAGIGSKLSHDDDWIAHQNDFNDLLSSLNDGIKGNADHQIKSLEDRVKSSKKKILYKRFVKSKDLSNASSHDLACIFGTRSKSAPATPQLSDAEDEESDTSAASCPVTCDKVDNEHGFTTVNTGVSVADYFAQKMAALKKSKCGSVDMNAEPVDETQCDEEGDLSVENMKKNKKKKKKKKNGDNEIEQCSDDENQTDGGSHTQLNVKKDISSAEEISPPCAEKDLDSIKRKKKKKRKIEDVEGNTVVVKKKKSRIDVDDDERVQKENHSNEKATALKELNCLNEQSFKKKKKKKKKKQIDE